MAANLSPPEHRISAAAHFVTGSLVVLAVALLSLWLHENSILRDLQMTVLDVFFLSQKSPDAYRVVVVSVTDDDYKSLFQRKSPLKASTVQDLIVASAKSGARVIGIDLDTSDWTAEDRKSLADRLVAAGSHPRIVWALSGSADPDSGNLHLDPLKGMPGDECDGLPASVPDRFGIVRGYLPAATVDQGGLTLAKPAMAVVLSWLDQHPSGPCAPAETAQLAQQNEEQLVNYAGGGARFIHLTASTVLSAAEGEAWRNYNPLKDRVVLIGGAFREARDKYVTPAGYVNGVDILASEEVSVEEGVHLSNSTIFLVIDVLLGLFLLTTTWFFRRAWVLVLSFVLIPLMSMAGSYLAFRAFGYFVSFVPVVAGVFFHHLVEHAIEHWRLTKEVKELRAREANLSAGRTL